MCRRPVPREAKRVFLPGERGSRIEGATAESADARQEESDPEVGPYRCRSITANNQQGIEESRHAELYGEQRRGADERGPAKKTAPSRGAVTPCNGADGRTRTGDMTLTKRLLYQLSYIGTRKKRTRAAAIVFDSVPARQWFTGRGNAAIGACPDVERPT